ncbi:GntR family transcriptional regulator [Bacillus sp. UNCCL81]|uniref:GntR family transcriptional regulator n=1 Tax=Bacillus sp. UNCCL81 TaxID=1502755 RepID=UPI0008F01760|nr:GntR family transcriptional regulator [Bacillus sp. UNCCL81]SFC94460.1 DNA-binding transcriptional regulator, GntR family [Bacillus sp. UNCCL81]
MAKEKTLEQIAYEKLKSLILSGEYQTGMHLKETALVSELQMSRTPIRRALGRLVSEGLLSHNNFHGTTVTYTHFTLHEIINMIEIQWCFAVFCVEKSQRKHTPFNVKLLREMTTSMEKAYNGDDAYNYHRALTEFYKTFLLNSQNNLIIEMLDNLWKRFTEEATSSNVFNVRKNRIPHTLDLYNSLIDRVEKSEFDKATEILTQLKEEAFMDLMF